MFIKKEAQHGDSGEFSSMDKLQFGFGSADLTTSQEPNSLFASWYKGLRYIEWWVPPFEEDDKARLTSIADTKNCHLSLYPIPAWIRYPIAGNREWPDFPE